MSPFLVELIKLKRSQAWTVVVILPLVMAAVGTVNTIASGEQLADGWNTLWLRTVVFYGLFPLALGIGVLASLVWRSEHRGGNWNALMSGSTSTLRIVVAKAGVVATLAAAMHVVLLAAVVVVGKVVFGLPELLPTRYVGIGLLVIVASVPLAALQSALSMIMRSFAAPIAVALVGAGVAVVLLTATVHTSIYVLPYALVARASQLETGSFGDTGALSVSAVVSIVAATVLQGTVLIASTTRLVERGDVHA